MFIPHTEFERQEMLKVIGKDSLESLFSDIPEKYRFPKLDLPPALSEMEALQELTELADANNSCDELICFLGAGAYNHYVPAAVDMLLRCGDFFTAYTPYQPEISQGTLQAIFEFQSLIANLTGMEVSNASHYDGATACAEACISAYHHFRGKRTKILISPALHPHYSDTIHTYLGAIDKIEIADKSENIQIDSPQFLVEQVNENTALVIIQYPDFLGRIMDFTNLGKAVHDAGALLAVAVNPIALGLLKPPSEFGADFVVGEGQPLGIPMSFGGPYLGFFATRNELIRKISGRIVGETIDGKGNRGYVLTLTAREQHIRREKATSNICTNQALMALAATIYMSLLGKSGLRKVAELCYQKAHYAAEQIAKIPGYKVNKDWVFFNEFVVEYPADPKIINDFLLHEGVLGGLDLGDYYPEEKNKVLFAVTEKITRGDIDILTNLLQEVGND
ncbi:MAG: aminomethyl-transferring glycine dehydrogenase subunit GcvPA [Anaerolineaceae bacterium]|jgi:glycine dehydrogenase subunit 1|nr:aminomethyl-transferring glycine dehydrogenase subunit GcvPA [Anaerolineaceae bacterium]